MRGPNFFIIGAAKAGTTSLHTALAQHPQIYMSPVKEPNFFALSGKSLQVPKGTISDAYLASCITTWSDYQQLFAGVKHEVAIGEASPSYLYYPETAQQIRSRLPEAKLIAILRDPVDRAYSNFLHHVQRDFESTDDFLEALQQEDSRLHQGWWWGFSYLRAGFYYQQLKPYFDRFDANQIQVYLYQDLQANFSNIWQQVLHFLEVDTDFVPTSQPRHNATGIPKNLLWHRFLSQANPLKTLLKPLVPSRLRQQMVVELKNRNLDKPALSTEIRQRLIGHYREDILQLQGLINRDLSAWLVSAQREDS
jgi:Sulfotransferase family